MSYYILFKFTFGFKIHDTSDAFAMFEVLNINTEKGTTNANGFSSNTLT